MLRQFQPKGLKLLAPIVALMMLSSCNYVDFASPDFGSETAYALLFLTGGSYMAMMNGDGTLQTPVGISGTFNPVDCTRLPTWRPLTLNLRKFINTATSSSYIYFADLNSNSVGVWDFMSGRFLPSIPVGNRPRGIAITPDGNTLVVSNSGSASVSIIDANASQVVATISLPAGSSPYGVAVTPDDKRAYVANYVNPGSIFVIDLTSRALIATIPGGNQPIHLAMSPDGSLVYATNFAGNTVSVIDTLTNTVTTTISGFQSPSAITTSMNGRYIYVTNVVASGTVTVLDSTTYAVATTVAVGGLPVALAPTPDGRFLFVANLDSAFLSQISTETNTLLRSIPFEKGVQSLVMWQ
jgi:YVTN family beta-propeller protein